MIIVYLTNETGELQVFRSDSDIDIIKRIVPRSWVYLLEPTEEEIQIVSLTTKISEVILRTALDEEESAHIDAEGDVSIVVVDTPVLEVNVIYPQINHFYTIPLSILYNKDFIVTSTIRKDLVVPSMIAKTMKNFNTARHVKLTIQLLYRNAAIFVNLLKQLDKDSEYIQDRLQESLENSELFGLMNLSKSLVYLSTGLNSDLIVMERLRKTEEFRANPDDYALIDDAIIENRQAIEMCSIHREILNGTMDTYASVISNNVNTIMKTLTVVTIVLTIPMIVAAFFGMNVDLPVPTSWGFAFAAIFSLAGGIIAGIFLSRYTSRLNSRWKQKEKKAKNPFHKLFSKGAKKGK
jgi:magnesium transporter